MQIARSTYLLTLKSLAVVSQCFVMPKWRNKDKNTAVDSALEIVLITGVKCITKQQYSSDLWPLKIKRNCVVDKSLKIIKKCSTFDP
jgi:hypothetical protein